MPSTANNQELKACFTEQSFYLDYEIAPAKSWFAIDKELARELYDRYLDNHNKMLFRLGFFDSSQKLSVSMSFLHNIAACYIKRLSHTENIEFTREDTVITPTDDETAEILRSVPFVVGLEFINAAWINNIYLSLSQVFANEIQAYTGTVEEFLLEQNSRINMVGRVFFHLVENKSEEYPFAFLATYSTARAGEKKASHTPLKNALLEYQNQDNKLLQLLTTVSKAAQKSDLISEFVESGELFSPLKLTSNEAYIFLQEIPLYEECGILCRIPDWWKKKSNSLKLSIQLGNREPSQVGMDALLDFDARLFLGEDEISEEEIRDLLTQSSGLLLIKGKWVEVDQQKLQLTLEAYQNAKKLAGTCDYTIAEAMRLQLNAREALGIKGDAVAIEVSHGKWLQNVAARMANPALINDLALSGDFRTSLRGYQQKGLDWLYYMKQLGFGACLADDMGLGKTVQIIALLEYLRVNSDERALLIIPASLMGNWQKEIEKFAPMLKYKAIYNSKEKYDLENRDGTNLYITTYGMAVRMEELKTLHWDLLILDEAQAIKNPGTKQSKAVKQLPAKAKIALTGTPVENSLSDLWSLFDFLNAGLLGTVKEFKDFAQK
ncbi:MAG: SNF2-related protein, partial [Syntrophomonas sp.]|nr:SNF2-related protein [Syntrophomonas sp.]